VVFKVVLQVFQQSHQQAVEVDRGTALWHLQRLVKLPVGLVVDTKLVYHQVILKVWEIIHLQLHLKEIMALKG
tara:strand:+ start:185 stop:403 length:219 start_codon:yes stop_codon:yes gene_type:complete